MEYRSTNIRVIMDKVLRNPLMKDMPFETGVDYTVDFIRLSGCPPMFKEAVVRLSIRNHRILLPCDFESVIQMRDSCTMIPYRYTTDSFHMTNEHDMHDHGHHHNCGNGGHIHGYEEIADDKVEEHIHHHHHHGHHHGHNHVEFTYKIQGNVIFTTVSHGEVELAYRAIDTDSEGFPLLPDNAHFQKALQYYIMVQYLEPRFMQGKLSDRAFSHIQQEYAWAIGSWKAEQQMMNLDEIESFKNTLCSIIMNTNAHANGYRNVSRRNTLINHNRY